MKVEIIRRTVDEANYLIENKCTIRECAKAMSTSKTTTQKDLAERLLGIDNKKYKQVRRILKDNWDDRNMRGGAATRQLYKNREIGV